MDRGFDDIPVLKAAKICDIRLLTNADRHEVLAVCPFCGDERKHFSMNTVSNQYQCFKCGAKGNSITLYGDVAGVDYKTAYKRLTEGKKFSGDTRRRIIPQKTEREPRPLEDRHEVYYDMLRMCDLNPRHMNNLLDRGLDRAFISKQMYRSVPTGHKVDAIAERLAKDYDLLGIPGFYTENGRWKMIAAKGFFIPILTANGYIQGFQIRYDADFKRRYGWFSSKNEENGTKAYSWIHVAGWKGDPIINLTEGGLKGDVAYYYSSEPYCCLPGVKCLSGLTEWLRIHQITHVNECWDMDKFTNPDVMNQLALMKKILKGAGIGYSQNTWVSKFKGIDDFHKYMNELNDPFQYQIIGRYAA